MDVPGPLSWLAPGGGLSGLLRRGLKHTGVVQALTTRTAIVDLLDLADVTVPYAERSAPLGLDRFPLALDGADHEEARQVVAAALLRSDGEQRAGVDDAEQVVRTNLDEARGRGAVDVVSKVIDPALVAWVERWFGLPGCGPDLLRCGRLITHATFLNPPLPAFRVDLGGLRRAVDEVQAQHEALLAPMAEAPPGTVSHALLQVVDPELAASHLLGLTVGPLALGSKALAEGVDLRLDGPWTAASIPTAEHGEAAFATLVDRCPPLPGVLRHNPVERRVQGGRRRVTVPAGLVLAATACPAHRGDVGAPALAYGHGRHRCLGEAQITGLGGRVLWLLGQHAPSRVGRLRAAPRPLGVRRWSFPGRLVVSLDA